ncbi:hypothetical protein BD410DRAFT_846499 [Rickenella mellea]|uniref:F-box domain-containing protein n=1 Tax=Rickenella mellea TaxID=50990 RepID=A0A4Y7PFV6_9AGAM|nr:hypothetical protein BD410DRAFT_846499 [Rickenella mellea]
MGSVPSILDNHSAEYSHNHVVPSQCSVTSKGTAVHHAGPNKRRKLWGYSETPRPTSICRLPPNIVLEVVKNLDLQHIYSMTAVSRHFADISIPYYLQSAGFVLHHQKMQRPSVQLSTTASFAALNVWNRSSMWEPLHSLHCRFAYSADLAELQARHLHLFLQSLPYPSTIPHVSTVTLIIEGAERTRLTGVLKNLFVAGMHHLRIIHKGPAHFGLNLSPVCEWKDSRLVQMDVHGLVIFSPDFSSFAGIQNLSLHCASLTNHWANMLATVILPNLQKFRLYGVLPCLSLMIFLGRHTLLQSVRVIPSSDSDSMPLSKKCPKTSLPNIEYLDGPVKFVEAFLTCLDRPAEKLSSISIRPEKSSLRAPAVGKVFALAPPNLQHIILHFPYDDDCKSFMDAAKIITTASLFDLWKLSIVRRGSDNHANSKIWFENIVMWIKHFPAVRSVTVVENGIPRLKRRLLEVCDFLPESDVFTIQSP